MGPVGPCWGEIKKEEEPQGVGAGQAFEDGLGPSKGQ